MVSQLPSISQASAHDLSPPLRLSRLSLQGLHADEMGDVVALPVKQKTRPALPEPALPPRAPSAAKTLLLFDFDKTLTDWDAGSFRS